MLASHQTTFRILVSCFQRKQTLNVSASKQFNAVPDGIPEFGIVPVLLPAAYMRLLDPLGFAPSKQFLSSLEGPEKSPHPKLIVVPHEYNPVS